MKRNSIIKFIVIILLLSIAIPIVINELYKHNTGYMTIWGAPDVLAYFGSIFGALGSIFIGIVALYQSDKANKISDRLLELEEKNNTPFLFIDTNNSRINTFRNHEIDISIYFRNTMDNVVNILNVSELRLEPLAKDMLCTVPFCTTWTKHYSVFPDQSREMNFFIETATDKKPINNFEERLTKGDFIQMTCELTLKVGYVNCNDVFEQTYEFELIISNNPDTQKPILFESIESSITKL